VELKLIIKIKNIYTYTGSIINNYR